MKLYLSLDMEGMPGTFNWEHEKTDRASVKRYYRAHVENVLKAVLAHPKAKEIQEIRIADSHSAGDNLDYEITLLDERISLISGAPRPLYMMPALEKDFDQVWLLGYHASTGAYRANMDHSYSNSRIHKIRINEQPMSEALINAAYAGHLGVGVNLVSGDSALAAELNARDALPWVNYVCTKRAMGKFSALSYSALAIQKSIEQAVDKALNKPKDQIPLYTFDKPIKLFIEFQSTAMADQACLMPYVKRLDGRCIEYVDDDYAVVFEAIMALVTLASTANL